MSNTFLSTTAIARDSILALENNLVWANLVHKDFSDDFAQQGDNVAVRVPATFTANTFSTTATAQNITESSVIASLDTIKTVDVEITSKQLTLNVEDFAEQVINPAMYSLANAIDEDIAKLAKKIGYVAGSTGTTASSLSDLASVGKRLNNNKVPLSQRRLVINPDAHASLVVLDAIAGADKAGSTDALREASLGKLLGFDMYMNQNVQDQSTSSLSIGDTLIAGTAVSSGASSILLSATALTGSLSVGDRLVSTALSDTYAVVTGVTASGNKLIAELSQSLKSSVASGTVFTIVGAHAVNCGFHKNAFALVTRPLALPTGGAEGAYINYNGLSIRVTRGYTMSSKTNVISFDTLYGVKVLDSEKGCVLYG